MRPETDIIKKIEKDILADELGIYSLESRQELLDEDAISPEEEAFMHGYDGA